MYGWRAQRQRGKWARVLLLAVALVVFLMPLAWSLLASINILPDDSSTPPTWTWHPSLENYVDIGVTTPAFAEALAQSVTISTAATGLTIAIALLGAYSLARSYFRGARVVAQSFLILASIPVMAFAIPLALVVRALHLYDSFIGVVLAASAFLAPLAVYILYGCVRHVSIELEDAARLDGANMWRIIRHVILPATSSGVAATAIIVFILNWNMLLIPLLLGESRIKTIPTIMIDFFYMEREIDWQSAAAVLIISLLPLLVLIGVAHRLLERFSLTTAQSLE
jgi:multiple sugar transport system permease protein